MKPKYEPYKPSRFETLVDKAVAAVSPSRQLRREMQREQLQRFRYQSALSNTGRRNVGPHEHLADTAEGNRERLQLQWNALELVERSGLASGIRFKLTNYICGTIRYQGKTGDKYVNEAYESYIKTRLGKGIDVAGRRTFRQMLIGSVNGVIVKGDAGINVVREDYPRLMLQPISADRIGNPHEYKATDNYVGGIHLDDVGGYKAFDIYTRNRRTGSYSFETQLPARDEFGLPSFLFTANPIFEDDIRGRTLFGTVVDNVHYLSQMRLYELQAMNWASSRSGVFHTKDGKLPDLGAFDDNALAFGATERKAYSVQVRPNELLALGLAEDVKMFDSQRPSPNVLRMWDDTIREIATGMGLSYGFVWNMSGATGPAVRYMSGQDKRAIQYWQHNLRDDVIDPAIILILGEGIAKGDIPYHERWSDFAILFPPHPTIDAGRESQANLNEYAAMLTSGSDLVAEGSRDLDEVHEQCGREARNRIEIAFAEAQALTKLTGERVDWREVMSQMFPGNAVMLSPQFEAARATQLEAQAAAAVDRIDNPDQPGATSEGEEIE